MCAAHAAALLCQGKSCAARRSSPIFCACAPVSRNHESGSHFVYYWMMLFAAQMHECGAAGFLGFADNEAVFGARGCVGPHRPSFTCRTGRLVRGGIRVFFVELCCSPVWWSGWDLGLWKLVCCLGMTEVALLAELSPFHGVSPPFYATTYKADSISRCHQYTSRATRIRVNTWKSRFNNFQALHFSDIPSRLALQTLVRFQHLKWLERCRSVHCPRHYGWQ